jgi:hypothetical protein
MSDTAEQLLYSLTQARQQLGGISHEKLYQLVRAGDLEIVKLGRRSFVARDELTRFAASLPPFAA